MSADPLANVIVLNYNYGRFLREAIDGALNQTYRNTEVVVVDDGSTDDSRDIISSYGQRVIAVLKSNGGMASTLNAGFAASRGKLLLFLDADDVLLPDALSQAVPLFDDGQTVLVQWQMWEVDGQGHRNGRRFPEHSLSE